MPREEIFKKFKAGTLKSGSGGKVTDKKQAVAIAMKYGSMKGLSEMPGRVKSEGYMHNVRGSYRELGASAPKSKPPSGSKRHNLPPVPPKDTNDTSGDFKKKYIGYAPGRSTTKGDVVGDKTKKKPEPKRH